MSRESGFGFIEVSAELDGRMVSSAVIMGGPATLALGAPQQPQRRSLAGTVWTTSMISRRQLLSLTVCGCATCGGFGISSFARSAAWADSTTAIKGDGYDLWFIGAQRETIMNGKLAAALDLRTLASRPHLYGIGPMEQLRGEVTIADSRPALARVASDGAVKVTPSFEVARHQASRLIGAKGLAPIIRESWRLAIRESWRLAM
jgi:hypothetical protein